MQATQLSETSKAVSTIQNPALGAILIWRFVIGYAEEDCVAPLEMVYIVLPVVFEETMRAAINGTKSGLVKCHVKLHSNMADSALLRVAEAAPMLYGLTSESIASALACGLVSLDAKDAKLRVARKTMPSQIKMSSIEKDCMRAARKLGKWVANLSKDEIEALLGVRL